jgi:hypothetical protein
MSKKKKKKDDDYINIKTEKNSDIFNSLLGEVKSLPDDTFVHIPHDAVIDLQISGNFMYTLRAALAYLMNAEEPYTVVQTLQKIKTGYKGVPQSKRTPYDAAVDAVTTLINEITLRASRAGKTEIYDKEEFLSGLDKEMSEDRLTAAKPLNEEELAQRMGLRKDNEGNLILDKDYLKKKGMDKTVSLEDGVKGHFGRSMEEILEDENSAKPLSKRKENRQKKWTDD